MRDRLLDGKLFGEPAWDILLALYHLAPLGRELTVSGLCCCAGVPQTTAFRWQATLFKQGLIERCPHDTDHRMHFVRLTERGRTFLEEYLTRLFHCEREAVSGTGPTDEDTGPLRYISGAQSGVR
jgi:DNA-binding MarR family transcriptional regulator